MDILVDYGGQLWNFEVKSGGAQRTLAQVTKDAAMEQGAKLIGRNIAVELRGQTRNIQTYVYRVP